MTRQLDRGKQTSQITRPMRLVHVRFYENEKS